MIAPMKWWNGAPAREMTRCNGWVMARRPGSIPFTVYAKDWDALPDEDEGRALHEQFQAARDGK